MRSEEIKLYGKYNNFIKFVSWEHACSLIRSGKVRECYRRVHGKPKWQWPFIGVQFIDPGSTNSSDSAATISPSESETNALSYTKIRGARSRTERLTEEQKRVRVHENRKLSEEDHIELARAKVRLWPEIGDTKAVRVGPLGVMRPE